MLPVTSRGSSLMLHKYSLCTICGAKESIQVETDVNTTTWETKEQMGR